MLCVGFGLGSKVRAQSVALDMQGCSEPTAREVRAVLGVELHELLLSEGDPVPADAHVVEVSCTGDTAELWLRGTTARRRVALANVPHELRARLLALSVAELARPQPVEADVAREASPAPEQPVEVAAAAPEPGPTVDAQQPQPAYFAWAGLEMQATPLTGFGGAVLFRARLGERIAWSSALGLAQARTEIDRGELQVLSLSLRTGLALLLLQGASGSLHLGAGVRGTWQRLTGEPSDAASTGGADFDAWALGPAVFAGATWSIAAPVIVALELEGAHMLREVHAHVERGQTKTLSPVSFAAVLGAGVAW
ncbi:MAG TPA: hypothetical protein VJV78_19850 [Polyangiales bacterium]|nr:hypothetical protein [Polyangiales bacterium]